MSSETLNRKKRPTPTSVAVPEVDHRKRRRNRTTQSCLNCHTSKRMCDRKRPACARCTQLGLTGLCVYEVDDPNQRSDSQDESARLLKRVAELEGVIRELKNKPHPRWVQGTGNLNHELGKWNTRSHLRAGSEGSQEDSASHNTPSTPGTSSEKSEVSSPDTGSSSGASSLSNALPPSMTLSLDYDQRVSRGGMSSPQSTPSPALFTPTEEFSQSHISVAAGQSDGSHGYDITSMFLSYPGLLDCNSGAFGQSNKSLCYMKTGHCGCLHEMACYNVLLELSLRLRRAVEVLSRSANHQVGNQCSLQRRIAELDTFTSNTLGNVSIPPEELSTPLLPRSDGSNPTSSTAFIVPRPFAQSCRPLMHTNITPDSLQDLQTWDLLPTVGGSPTTCDDSFMSWEPPRRS